MEKIAAAVAEGRLAVPIANSFPIEEIVQAVEMQQDGHVHGKITVTL
jgi:NADPH:quinone reductase-like Zn-dependent oxidoreductase